VNLLASSHFTNNFNRVLVVKNIAFLGYIILVEKLKHK
jgi:hypothetical protein